MNSIEVDIQLGKTVLIPITDTNYNLTVFKQWNERTNGDGSDRYERTIMCEIMLRRFIKSARTLRQTDTNWCFHKSGQPA